MQKATGVDMTDYDGAIINLYEKDTFISAHNDVDESKSAIKYPVIGINLGGKGNFSIERIPGAGQLNLEAGTAYVFGVDGVNREVWHRTFPTPQDSFLPELTTKIDGKTYPAGSYRVTITMRRVKSIRPGMPTAPSIVSTQPADTRDLTSISETIENLKAREAELIIQKEEVLDNVFEAVVIKNLLSITPESAKKETGLKTGTTKDINPAWLSKDGVSVKEAAHRIWEDFYFESNYDTQDVRNVIIDALTSAKSKKSYLDDITGQTEINQIRKDIKELQQQLIAPTTIESDLSNNLNQPEGLPAIRRSSPNCG
jgi:hypothetical protein